MKRSKTTPQERRARLSRHPNPNRLELEALNSLFPKFLPPRGSLKRLQGTLSPRGVEQLDDALDIYYHRSEQILNLDPPLAAVTGSSAAVIAHQLSELALYLRMELTHLAVTLSLRSLPGSIIL